mmetsp:Transcript_42952/g.107154  ORF Transcript_42952/g.107154 Transcript_42952/m.107154 type:complete len:83 (-) Transcript_42952:664-912(-)
MSRVQNEGRHGATRVGVHVVNTWAGGERMQQQHRRQQQTRQGTSKLQNTSRGPPARGTAAYVTCGDPRVGMGVVARGWEGTW